MLQHLQFMRHAHERMLHHTSKLEQEKELLAQRLERERQEQEKAQETNIKLQKEIKRLARPERQREEDEICSLVQHSQFNPECFPNVRVPPSLTCIHASLFFVKQVGVGLLLL
jgi:predicted nuclease with TOPRIM domain